MQLKKGLFISAEGCEGSGKTTILNLISNYLKNEGFELISTREPGGIKIAEQIRNVILDTGNTEMDPKTEALLYASARAAHLNSKVIPALEQGKIVLCDRFIDSSLAYQGYARGIGMEDIYTINKFAIGPFMPDITLYFDISPEVGLSRIQKNKEREVNRLDLESMEFHTKVREGYHILLKQEPKRIKLINAEASINTVFEEALEKILDFINN